MHLEKYYTLHCIALHWKRVQKLKPNCQSFMAQPTFLAKHASAKIDTYTPDTYIHALILLQTISSFVLGHLFGANRNGM